MKKKLIIICIFECVLIAFVWCIAINYHTIFPVIDDDEYFVDKYDIVHNGRCPDVAVPWFQTKAPKFYFIKNKNWIFCDKCFSAVEQQQMYAMHTYNLKIIVQELRKKGSSNEEIQRVLYLMVK